jgi:hypothetical protein
VKTEPFGTIRQGTKSDDDDDVGGDKNVADVGISGTGQKLLVNSSK